MKYRLLILAAAFLGVVAGCRDKDHGDDSTPIVDPGPSPEPGPQPEPEPEPQPEPEPEPQPEPEPPPEPPGWFEQMETTGWFETVSAVDPQHAWASDGSDVFRTVNGGATWAWVGRTPVLPGGGTFRPSFRDLHFLNQQEGWGFTRQHVLWTSDAGATWEIRRYSADDYNQGMSFLDANTGWICTRHGGLHKTTNGGQTWTHQELTNVYEAGRQDAVKFVNAQTGWLSVWNNNTAYILKSTDGGATWPEQMYIYDFYDEVELTEIFALNSQVAWIGGKNSPGGWNEVLLKTTDGGATWKPQDTGGDWGIQAIFFINANVGWAAGEDMYYTTDGGTTWTIQDTPRKYFEDIVFVNETTGWAGATGLLKTSTAGIK